MCPPCAIEKQWRGWDIFHTLIYCDGSSCDVDASGLLGTFEGLLWQVQSLARVETRHAVTLALCATSSHAIMCSGLFLGMDDLDPIAIYALFGEWDPQTECCQDNQAGA